MLGYYVDQNTLNMKAAQVAVGLRTVFDQVEGVAAWLGNHPVVDGVDPLVANYQYTQDEAYALRLYFDTFEDIRTGPAAEAFTVGRKITGLE